MLFAAHVDEIENDDAAEVAQAQLTRDGRGGFQIGLDDGFFKIAMTGEGTGVDVDGGHGLGLVDHQMPARLEFDLAFQRAVQLVFHAVQVEDRRLAAVSLDFRRRLRHEDAGELLHPARFIGVVDAHPFHRSAEQVAQDAHRQRQVAMHQLPRPGLLHLLGHRAPQSRQEQQVLLQRLGIGAFRRGARDHAPLRRQFRHQGFQNALEPGPLGLVLDLGGDADMLLERHQHQVARRDRQQGGQARALAAERVLEDLHQDFLAFVQQALHRRQRRRVGLGVEHVGDVQESGALQADIDERRLHAGQHALDHALVNIADQAMPGGALHIDLLRRAAFDQGHARFLGADVDQDLGTHASTPKRDSNSLVSYSGRPTTPL